MSRLVCQGRRIVLREGKMKEDYWRLMTVFLGFIFLDVHAVSACTLDTILEMRERGAGRAFIERQCPSLRVDDMPRCNRSQVLAHVFGGRNRTEISDFCGPCEPMTCLTRFGECQLNVRPPQNQRLEGMHCYCPSFAGPVPGEVFCD